MKLKPEVVRSLERETRLSEAALLRLEERCRAFEMKYGWSTEEFLHKFDAGEIEDDQDYFLWYALAQAREDWQVTRKNLDEVLASAETGDV